MTLDDFNAALSDAVNAAQSLAPTAVSLFRAIENALADARRVHADAERLVAALKRLHPNAHAG
jgi:hypothetical protein